MIRLHVSAHIHAEPAQVAACYAEFRNWHCLFPLTIESASLLVEEEGEQTILVEHKKAGKVLNRMTILSPTCIQLKEDKSFYKAAFMNSFRQEGNGTNYEVQVSIYLKGLLRYLTPLLRGLIKKRIRQYVLMPVKDYVERHQKITTTYVVL